MDQDSNPTGRLLEPVAPNVYELQGGQLQIRYTTSALDGKPHFVYQDANGTLFFVGDQIHTVQTDIGTLVTVTIQRAAAADLRSFTLVVPRVDLTGTDRVPIATAGITTFHCRSAISSADDAQRERYAVTDLRGLASRVRF
jgi:hypothetical protein